MQRAVNARRDHTRLFDRAIQDAREAHDCVAYERGDRVADGVVETSFRVARARFEIVMLDHKLIVCVGGLSPGAHHGGKPSIAAGRLEIRIAARLQHRLENFVRLGKALLHRAVDDPLFLGLVRVEGLDWVDIIVTEHAGRPRGLLPIPLAQRTHGAPVPFFASFDCAAPFAFTNVEHMVLEVLEFIVRGLRAGEVFAVMVQHQLAPGPRVRGAQVAQRLQRQAVMVGAASACENHCVQERHALFASAMKEALMVLRFG